MLAIKDSLLVVFPSMSDLCNPLVELRRVIPVTKLDATSAVCL